MNITVLKLVYDANVSVRVDLVYYLIMHAGASVVFVSSHLHLF